MAIVTGAGSGIGEGIARRFVQEGARVAVCDLNMEAATRVANELNKSVASSSSSPVAIPVRLDVTDEQAVDSGFQHAVEKLGGKLDVLVSNAGVQHIEPLVDLKFSDWRKIVSVHLDASFLCTRAALRYMYKNNNKDNNNNNKPQGGSSIIYIGSVHSKTASLLKAPYVSAKHGVMGLCRAVAKEGAAHNVRANVICPGFVLTPLVTKQIPEQAKTLNMSEEDVVKKVMLKDTVDGQFTTIEDVAETAVFLAGFKTNALTGQSLIVSHGWFME